MTGVGEAAADTTSRERVARKLKSIVDGSGGEVEGLSGFGDGDFERLEVSLYTSNTGAEMRQRSSSKTAETERSSSAESGDQTGLP